jgi:hypothetical protein
METGNIELTPQQKGMLASLSQETGEPVSALIDKALEDLQEHMRTGRANGKRGSHAAEDNPKPIWEVFADVGDIPEEEWEKLPTDLATQHDHYIYGTPKRPV